MKILVLTFYYKPDLSAGSFRVTSIIESLIKKNKNIQLEVLTTIPNRYSNYKINAKSFESSDNLKIYRFKTIEHNSGFFKQALGFVKYSMFVLWHIKNNEYDLIFASSSRLMTAFLAVLIGKNKKTPIYIDIRDIFYDTFKDLKKNYIISLFKPIFNKVEQYTLTNSDKVNLVSKGFKEYFNEKYPKQNYTFLTNGIDEIFYDYKKLHKRIRKNNLLHVLYAGNIGEGQALETILPKLAVHFKNKVEFYLYGSGSTVNNLKAQIRENKIKNIFIKNPVNRELLKVEYFNSDILFLHLNDIDAFKKVLPSKLFEYAATGKPIWAGVGGYAKIFINKEIHNASLFDPCDVNSAVTAFNKIKLSKTNRDEFCQKYSRKKISMEISEEIISMIN